MLAAEVSLHLEAFSPHLWAFAMTLQNALFFFLLAKFVFNVQQKFCRAGSKYRSSRVRTRLTEKKKQQTTHSHTKRN